MPFAQRIRARYYEVDQQGVVFNMWYLGWFDEVMTAYLDGLGWGVAAMTAQGVDVQLVHSELDWRGSVRYGDDVEVQVRPERVGTTSFTLGFGVCRGDEELVTASTVYVIVGTDGSGKRPVPDALRAALERAAG